MFILYRIFLTRGAIFMKKLSFISAVLLSAGLIISAPVSAGAEGYDLKAEKKTADSFVLTWDEQEGADAYRVYIYDKAEGKYTAYKTVASGHCTVKGLKAGTSYKLIVRSLDKVKGKYKKISDSGAVSVKTLRTSSGSSSDVKYHTEYKYSATVDQMVKWTMAEKDMGLWSRAESYSKNYLNKFKNAGYIVEKEPHYNTQAEQRYYIYDKQDMIVGEVVVWYAQSINKVGDWSWGFSAAFYQL